MMYNAKYKDLADLEQAIQKYMTNETEPTPRHFRAVGLNISKHLVSTWQNTKPEFYASIKEAEDYILAMMEQKMAYGGKNFYNLFIIMRAYDRQLYSDSIAEAAIGNGDVTINFDLAAIKKKAKNAKTKPKS